MMIQESMIGVLKGDARSLDNSSCHGTARGPHEVRARLGNLDVPRALKQQSSKYMRLQIGKNSNEDTHNAMENHETPRVHALASCKNSNGHIHNTMALDENLQAHSFAGYKHRNEDIYNGMAIDENPKVHAPADPIYTTRNDLTPVKAFYTKHNLR